MSGFRGGRGGGGWSGGRGGYSSSQKQPNSGNGGPAPKKFRGGDEDDDDPMFDTFDDDEDMMLLGCGQSQMEVEELGQDVEMERAKSWRRPLPPPHDPNNDSLVFQQIEIDYYVGEDDLFHNTRNFLLQSERLN